MAIAVDYQRLREISLLNQVSDEGLAAIARRCVHLEVAAGETLFHQGDPGDAFYLLEDGQIHIVRQYDTGEEVVLATYGPYYTIGELSMLVGQPRTGSVVAVSDLQLLRLNRDDFARACDSVPGVATAVLSQVGLRFYQMNLQVREHAIGNVPARVGSLLLLLARDKAGAIPGASRITRMARAVGVDGDCEWFSREAVAINPASARKR